MNVCICCDSVLLRHLNHYRIYWFCPYCHQEMPNLQRFKALKRSTNIRIELKQKQAL